MAGLKVIDSSY